MLLCLVTGDIGGTVPCHQRYRWYCALSPEKKVVLCLVTGDIGGTVPCHRRYRWYCVLSPEI